MVNNYDLFIFFYLAEEELRNQTVCIPPQGPNGVRFLWLNHNCETKNKRVSEQIRLFNYGFILE